jgi:uncharacterized protein YndB with AHSA1/START domain
VWKAFTTADGIASWWADEARIDARVGGRVVLTTEDGEESGLLHICRPTRRLEIAWDVGGSLPSAGSRLQVDLARDGDETRVSLVISGGSATKDEEQREELVKGWRRALRQLRETLES